MPAATSLPLRAAFDRVRRVSLFVFMHTVLNTLPHSNVRVPVS